MSEKEKYQGIYTSTQGYSFYGCGNHGASAWSFMKDWNINSLLDVGCGHNYFVDNIRKERPLVRSVGVDFACPSADIIADAGELPFIDGEFDVITSFDMLEQRVLREFSRVGRSFCFSICYRPSIILWMGANLHPTVEPESWWIDQITLAGASEIKKHGKYIAGIYG